MKNLNDSEWMSEHETAYLEERKNKCEHCLPDHEETIAWLEGVCAQDIVYEAFKKYGISPKIIYKEFEEEFSSVYTAEEIEVFVQELAV